MQDFKQTLRPEQRNQPSDYYRRAAETKMRREAGSKFVANAIWAIGLPRLPEPLRFTRRRDRQLSAQDLEAVPGAIRNVLDWLDRIASALKQHRTTDEYQEALRKSGVTHGESGLNETELQMRMEIRKARLDIRIAKQLDDLCKAGKLTCSQLTSDKTDLLIAFRSRSLHRHLDGLQRQGKADPMCRMPLHALQRPYQ